VLIRGDATRIPLPDCTVDAVVTDPPYELGFMGRSWDSSGVAYQPETWAEVLRVLKPGGHLVSFGGTRTYHRMTVAIEDAGFEIRDCLAWLYGSGFPKSLDVSKALDKARDDRSDILRVTGWLAEQRDRAGMRNGQIDQHFGTAGMAGHWTSVRSQPAVPKWDQWLRLRDLIGFGDEMDAEVWRLNGRKGKPGEAWDQREVVGTRVTGAAMSGAGTSGATDFGSGQNVVTDTAPATPEAQQWQGWGTALKPAHEPIVLARKPLTGTVAANVSRWGTGALNIDGCRVEHGDDVDLERQQVNFDRMGYMGTEGETNGTSTYKPGGRWPPNVTMDEEAARLLDEQSGERRSAGLYPSDSVGTGNGTTYLPTKPQGELYGDTGGASRFMYVAKASRAERNAGLEGMPTKGFGEKNQRMQNMPTNGAGREQPVGDRQNQNHHPTVKPLALMRWLVRLVTPPGGTVLDPFLGSGTTMLAAHHEGFRCIGIEREAEYVEIAKARNSQPVQTGLC